MIKKNNIVIRGIEIDIDGFQILSYMCFFFGLVELAKSMFGSQFAGIYGLLYMILGTMIAIWRKTK